MIATVRHRVPVEAVVRQVERAPHEPRRPRQASPPVAAPAIWAKEPDRDVADDRVPEPRGIGRGTSLECGEVVAADLAEELPQVTALAIISRGAPGDAIGHGRRNPGVFSWGILPRITPRRAKS